MLINYQTGKDFFEDNAAFITSDELRNQFFLSTPSKRGTSKRVRITSI